MILTCLFSKDLQDDDVDGLEDSLGDVLGRLEDEVELGQGEIAHLSIRYFDLA